jgi:hypothetical protein
LKALGLLGSKDQFIVDSALELLIALLDRNNDENNPKPNLAVQVNS